MTRSKVLSFVFLLSSCAAMEGEEGPQAATKPVDAPQAKHVVDTRDPAVAQAEYEAEAARDTKNVNARINIGVMRERQWDLPGAEKHLEDALAMEPKNVDAALALARVLVKQQKADAADRVLMNTRKHVGDPAPLMLGLSSVARARKKYGDAVSYAKAVLLHDQANVDALNDIALAYLADGKLDPAELYAQMALKLVGPKAGDAKRASAEDGASLQVTLGLIQQKRGDNQKAMAFFAEATKRDPSLAIAHANAGVLALAYRDYALALSSFDAANGLGWLSKEVVLGRCYALEGLQKGLDAATCLAQTADKLAADDADLPTVLYALGTVHQNLTRDSDKALAAFRRYVEIKGTSISKNDRVLEAIRRLESRKNDSEAAPAPAGAEEKPKPQSKSAKKHGKRHHVVAMAHHRR
jgi:tetratricopeptide (TPR) repeat protein